MRVNVEGTVNLLDAARNAGATGFVLASSCAVYGEPDPADVPLSEDAPLRPGSPYGQAKLAAEGYVALYRELHGLRAASLRFGNVYGPRQGAVGEAGVVAIFCGRLLDGVAPTVFGDGSQTRDYIDVADVVAACLTAADALGTGWRPPGPLNVGTGTETSVIELVDLLGTIGGRSDFLDPGAAARRRDRPHGARCDAPAGRRSAGGSRCRSRSACAGHGVEPARSARSRAPGRRGRRGGRGWRRWRLPYDPARCRARSPSG